MNQQADTTPMKRTIKTLLILAIPAIFAIGIPELQAQETQPSSSSATATPHAITLIEFGSVSCIPCKRMQPILQKISETYGDKIHVLFYDLAKPENQLYAKKLRIRVMPTQIFLDNTQQEIFRHEGYFSEQQIQKVLARHGLAPNTTSKP